MSTLLDTHVREYPFSPSSSPSDGYQLVVQACAPSGALKQYAYGVLPGLDRAVALEALRAALERDHMTVVPWPD